MDVEAMKRKFESWCAPEGSCYDQEITRPFQVAGGTAAANGHLFVWTGTVLCPEIQPLPEGASKEIYEQAIMDIATTAPPGEPTPIAPDDVSMGLVPCDCIDTGRPHFETCPECRGEGEVNLTNGYNHYTCDCLTCEGEGRVSHHPWIAKARWKCRACKGTGMRGANDDPMPHIRIGAIAIDRRYAWKLVHDFGAMDFLPVPAKDRVEFRGEHIRGIVMRLILANDEMPS